MSWLKKILGFQPSNPTSPDEVLKKLDKLADVISQEVDLQRQKMPGILAGMEANPMMGEKEQISALESVYWAISLLRLIQKSEQGWIPQDWVPQLLNDILNEMESEKRGCRVRFARQMLQEYAEIQAENPQQSYEKEMMLSYFRAWLWECLKAPTAQKPGKDRLKEFDEVVSDFMAEDQIWA